MRRQVVGLGVVVAYLFATAGGFAADRLVPSEYPTIQAAIDAAVDGDTVIIAPGTHTGDGNRDIDFKGKAITVRGTDPNDPNIVEAIVIDCNGTQAEPHRGFYLKECVGAKISGLTITSGCAAAGGGIHLEDTKAVIEKCRIVGNRANSGKKGIVDNAGDGGCGGAIYSAGCSISVRDCDISNNMAGDGGAGSNDPDVCEWDCDAGDGGSGGGIYAESSSLTIERTDLAGNKAGKGGDGFFANIAGVGGDGGGVYCGGSTLELMRCHITENAAGDGGDRSYHGNGGHAGSGGGICCADLSSVTIYDSTITRNSTGSGGAGAEPDGHGGRGGDGGGIYCGESCSLEIHGCDIGSNMTPDGSSGNGGGICCVSSALTIFDSDLSGNAAGKGADGEYYGPSGWKGGSGGGVYCTGPSRLVLYDSEIRDNQAGHGGIQKGDGGDGGGICCADSSYLEMYDSAISGNRAGNGGDGADPGGGGEGGDGGNGGGIFAGTVMTTGCGIMDNEAGRGGWGGRFSGPGIGGHGGGIYCIDASMTDCLFEKNGTGKGGDGGGMAPACAKPGGNGGGLSCEVQATLTDCVFFQNRTGNGGDFGLGHGGNGGAAHGPNITATNCLFVGNRAGDGGAADWAPSNGGNGAAISCSQGLISSCTVSYNSTGHAGRTREGTTLGDRGQGGGVYGGEELVFRNTIVWGNEPEQVFGVDCNNVSFCDIGGDEWLGGVGNISGDPLFVAGPLGDYYLSQITARQDLDSRCLDAGSSQAVDLGLREFATRTDHAADSGIVDMGYHYPRVTTLGDVDYDGFVGWRDLALLAAQWLQEPGDPSADVEPDDVVDLIDLSVVGDSWLQCLVASAGSPVPSDGAEHVDTNLVLSWEPGAYSSSHDLYFGTTDPPPFVGNHEDELFDPGSLDPKTTHYWRVDEVGPRCVKQGQVWSFRTEVRLQGSGSSDDPYLIYDAQDMQAIGVDPNYWDKHFRLMADIDLSEYSGTRFSIIGGVWRGLWWIDTPFEGVFDGNLHTISNFNYGPTERPQVGLFGYTKHARIMNLGLVDPNVSSRSGYVGALVGSMEGGELASCYVEAGTVFGTSTVGGMVGYVIDGLLSKCHANTEVSGSGSGGLVGVSSGDSILRDCYSISTVSSSSTAGGLAGNAYRNVIIDRCYSAGQVTGGRHVGGLVGGQVLVKVDLSFWDVDVSGQTRSTGGVGKTTAEMKQQTTFEGWDFVNTWDIVEGVTYPFLRPAQ